MLIDRRNWAAHSPWILFTIAATIGASIWYFAASAAGSDWPGGSSPPGFTFGVLGGLICIFELLLWWKKKVRTWRIGTAQLWMRAHIWLGLLSVPLLVYHSGFRFGGPLSTVLMVLFLVVIASGIWGLALQQFLPRRMLQDIPAETIYSQIDHIVELVLMESEALVTATCGSPAQEDGKADEAPLKMPGGAPLGVSTSHLTIGAVRSAGQVQGKVLGTMVPTSPVPDSEALRHFYHETVVPYLKEGKRSDSPLANPNRARVMFQGLRTKLHPAAAPAVDALEGWCEQRRQLDLQARLHFWLHNWLWVHLPLAVALIALMLIHIWVALKYW